MTEKIIQHTHTHTHTQRRHTHTHTHTHNTHAHTKHADTDTDKRAPTARRSMVSSRKSTFVLTISLVALFCVAAKAVKALPQGSHL
jgi:Ca2+/H+ antiporter